MKIIYLDQELDPTQEHELFPKDGHVLDVIVKYKQDSPFQGNTEVIFNCTEVHWRFTDIFNPTPCDRVAFESDISSTGCTRAIEYIEYALIKENAFDAE